MRRSNSSTRWPRRWAVTGSCSRATRAASTRRSVPSPPASPGSSAPCCWRSGRLAGHRRGIIRRITRLTRRSSELSRSVQTTGGLERFDLADLRGSDELGILANCLNDLLRRVKEDAERERIRAEQEKDQWHAVGHEIMSPLQSLLALHGDPDDPSHRYINRMQQAVRILYGSASPSEAFQSIGPAGAGHRSRRVPPPRRRQRRHHRPELRAGRRPGPGACRRVPARGRLLARPEERRALPIRPARRSPSRWRPVKHRHGHHPQRRRPDPDELMDKIFEYGVSDQAEAGAKATAARDSSSPRPTWPRWAAPSRPATSKRA
jgi:hypothetical protein